MTNEKEKIVDVMVGAKTAVINCEDSYILTLIKKTIESLTSAEVQGANTMYYKVVVLDSKALELDNVGMYVVLFGILSTVYAHGYKADINGYYGYSFLKAIHILMDDDD